MSANASQTQFTIASELLTKVKNLDDIFGLLNEINHLYTTNSNVTQKDIILSIMKVTSQEFSEQVYEYYDISEEEVREILGFQIQARFGVNKFLMKAFDPSSVLSGYGCWCRYSSEPKSKHHSRSKSAPVDDIDHLCKGLQMSYDCLNLDLEEDLDATCQPSTQPYDFDISSFIMASMGLPSSNIHDNCQSSNLLNPCSQNTCEIELTFLTEFIRGILLDPNYEALYISDEFKHASIGGDFDDLGQCGIVVSEAIAEENISLSRSLDLGTVVSESNTNAGDDEEHANYNAGIVDKKACCGIFPKRTPYNTHSGDIGCCDGSIYHKSMEVCCDGVVGLSC